MAHLLCSRHDSTKMLRYSVIISFDFFEASSHKYDSRNRNIFSAPITKELNKK